MLIVTALLFGVVNPLVCIVHCVPWSVARADADKWLFLCLPTPGDDWTPPVIPMDARTSMMQSPTRAPLFDWLVVAVALLLLLVAGRVFRDGSRHVPRFIAHPPLVPPPRTMRSPVVPSCRVAHNTCTCFLKVHVGG